MRTSRLPADLDSDLIPASVDEGFQPLRWLRQQWEDGSNRFSEPGEALYTARVGGRLVGVCGINRDPFGDTPACGRLRRLYVLPAHRRQGIGRRLVLRVLAEATDHFDQVGLRTLDDHSAAFFESIGFCRVDADERVTHRIVLRRPTLVQDVSAQPSSGSDAEREPYDSG
ncbi:MAG: GNAT family N-acetyltransferase [Anaerolineae bacterium]